MTSAGPAAYAAAVDAFRWDIPARCNIAVEACDAWAVREPGRLAILHLASGGPARRVTYRDLQAASNRFADALRQAGIAAGDRVAVLLPQSPEVVVAHLAAARLGAISVPLACLFGPDALEHRLRDSGAAAIVLDAEGLARMAAVRRRLPALAALFCVDGARGDAAGFAESLAAASPEFGAAASGPDDPAMMIYSSGTTGPPKGAVHGHRVVRGHIPGVAFAHPGLGAADDVMWTPADWAWAGGLLNMLLPSLTLGVPVVAGPHRRFRPQEALALMRGAGVTRAFLPPTALRMMQAECAPGARLDTPLRSIMSAGETLGPGTYDWARQAFGFAVNELYGQTECNLVLGSCAALGVSRPGAIGLPVPGHRVGILRADDAPCAAGEEGEIAVGAPDPVMALGYWNDPEATAGKFAGPWMRTGDRAVRDAEGYVRFVGRDDDVIISAGYRIGPGEIEDCLMRHPAVAAAAAVGVPHPVRTEIVRAVLVLKPGFAPSDALGEDIRRFVRERLSAHEYPRQIVYVDALPMTASGKIVRRALRDAPAPLAPGGGPP